MFVLPPAPRYPNATTTTGTNGPNMQNPTLEMSNVLTHPTGTEYQLSVGEGTYSLQDSLLLATPPPHHQDAPIVSSNPLATTPTPPRVGVKISICVTTPRRRPPALYRTDTAGSTRSNLGTYSIKENEKESRSSHEASSDGYGSNTARTPVFGEDNHLLTPSLGKEGLKRKKPKTNLVKSNSQFISRVILNDQLQKRLQDHRPEGIFIFANIDRAYQWLDQSSPTPSRSQPLMKILFAKANVLCHDINHFTKAPNHIDVVTGANTGDIVWFEAFSQKYVRINKGNIISTSPISEIRWLPGSENLFLASHMDGTLIVYDKEREDAAFVPETANGFPTSPSNGDQISSPLPDTPSSTTTTTNTTPLHINKSVNSKNQKSNPVASWKLSNHCTTAFAFSPDSRHLAVVSEDGSLRIINYLTESLTDLYPSYYGAFICVCWSPDGKYVLTGGQDDLVSICSLHERRIIARCQGHHSWVTAVAFDPWRCDGRNYRFGSVGEDRRLLLWDFNIGMLRRPKVASLRTGGADNRASVSSQGRQGALGRTRTESQVTAGRLRSNSSLEGGGADGEDLAGLVEHEVESRTVTAELPPVMVS
ncbi:MAG: hypothetical protein OHK93_000961 [Ramalina farinacea]|uniref:Catabolite repression protein creC n=1 Tax=Ramalina farinacea TaxID=258253 RepID=A0AA43QNK8_9LECA|nr:hypothetical protein [Ramalina farinacea]